VAGEGRLPERPLAAGAEQPPEEGPAQPAEGARLGPLESPPTPSALTGAHGPAAWTRAERALAELCEALPGLRRSVADCQILVLVATEDEAAPLLAELGVKERVEVAGTSVVIPLQPAGVVVAIGGCDKVNAAHALTLLLASLERPPRLVLQVGVAGAFPGAGAEVGDLVVAEREVYSDLGASSPAGWLSAAELGLPVARVAGKECGGVFSLEKRLVEAALRLLRSETEREAWEDLRSRPPRVLAGTCLTSSRVSGTRAEAELLTERWQAVAESMEGAAAAHVCALHDVPFLEMRAISNLVVDRERGSWQIERAATVAARAARVLLESLERLPLSPRGVPSGGGSGGSAARPLKLAFSPCPNDTFIFHAWVAGLVPGAPAVEARLADIDLLNKLAAQGEVEVVKVSIHAFAHLRDRYALLHSGGALGRGVGPLVVARKDSWLRPAGSPEGGAALADELSRARVALPGGLTTAALLAQAFTGGLRRAVLMPFDHIMPAVAAGEVEAGVIIHEGRFTFASYGLRRLVDLGEWWEANTGLPLPLGGIAVSRSLDRAVQRAVEEAMHASVLQARRHPELSRDYVRAHAQEMDPAVCQAHIDLYVNDFTVDLGEEGEAAIRRLLALAQAHGAAAGVDGPLFWDEGE
jgi:1,4-dihydroxy-6-naphthoate synthase